MVKGMDNKQFGLRWGISGQYVGRLVKRGMLPTIGGKISVKEADAVMKGAPIKGKYDEPQTPGQIAWAERLFKTPIRVLIEEALRCLVYTRIGIPHMKKVENFIKNNEFDEYFKTYFGLDIDKLVVTFDESALVPENYGKQKRKNKRNN